MRVAFFFFDRQSLLFYFLVGFQFTSCSTPIESHAHQEQTSTKASIDSFVKFRNYMSCS